MRLTVNLDTDQFVIAPGVAAPLSTLYFKRGASARLEIQFTRAAAVQELPADATGAFELKATGEYDADPLVSAGSWVKSGAGATALYTFTLDLINAALDALFVVDDNPANDVPEITLMAELQWIAERFRHKSQTLTVFIANDVNRE